LHTENQFMEPTRTPKRRRRPETFTVSFRVDSSHLKDLEKGAVELGISLHEYARILTYQALDQELQEKLLDGQERTEKRLDALREDIALTLETVLLNVVKGTSKEQLQSWVDENLRGRV
jgi:hypothetical protein